MTFKTRKDLIFVSSAKVWACKGKNYFKKVIGLPNSIEAGKYDLILIPK